MDFMNVQICARVTNVGPDAPDGPLNGSEPNVHVFGSSLPVGSVNVGQSGIVACHLKNFTTAANTTLYPPGQTPPPIQNMDMFFLYIFPASSKKEHCSAAVALANSALFKVSLWWSLWFSCRLPWK